MKFGQVLNRTDIRGLIPQTGAMCLLSGVSAWDETRLIAQSDRHLQPDYPLRVEGRVRTVCALESAAQAMALHGALCAGGTAQSGYLASVRGVNLHQPWLPDAPMQIQVNAVWTDQQGFTDTFAITCDEQPLISGKITIFLSNTVGDNV